MRLSLFIIAVLSFILQSCSMIPANYGSSGGYCSSGYSYSSASAPVELNLVRLTGNDLNYNERSAFLKVFKEEMARLGRVTLNSSSDIRLKIVINVCVTKVHKYKTVNHGLLEYHLDQNYDSTIQYVITDRADHTPVNHTIHFKALVKGISGMDYQDAKRISQKRLFEAMAKRTAQDINAKYYLLAKKYN